MAWLSRAYREAVIEGLFWLLVIVFLSAVIIGVGLQAWFGPPPELAPAPATRPPHVQR